MVEVIQNMARGVDFRYRGEPRSGFYIEYGATRETLGRQPPKGSSFDGLRAVLLQMEELLDPNDNRLRRGVVSALRATDGSSQSHEKLARNFIHDGSKFLLYLHNNGYELPARFQSSEVRADHFHPFGEIAAEEDLE